MNKTTVLHDKKFYYIQMLQQDSCGRSDHAEMDWQRPHQVGTNVLPKIIEKNNEFGTEK